MGPVNRQGINLRIFFTNLFLRITYLEPEGRFLGLKAFVILVFIELPELGLDPLELELGLEPPLFLA